MSCIWKFYDIISTNHTNKGLQAGPPSSTMHTFSYAGSFQVTLTCLNSLSSETATLDVSVSDNGTSAVDILGPAVTYTGASNTFCVALTFIPVTPTTISWTIRSNNDSEPDVGNQSSTSTQSAMLISNERCIDLVFSSPGIVNVSFEANGGMAASRLVHIFSPIVDLSLSAPAYVAVGKTFNINVSLVDGSDLYFFWLLGGSSSAVTRTPFTEAQFSTVGNYTIFLEAVNDVDFAIAKTSVTALEILHSAKILSAATSAFVSRGSVVHFFTTVSGSQPQFFWQCPFNQSNGYSTSPTFFCAFPNIGTFTVKVHIVNNISDVFASYIINVIDPLDGIAVLGPKAVKTGSNFTITVSVSQGSNYTLDIYENNGVSVYQYDEFTAPGQFNFTLMAGRAHHTVLNITCANNISSAWATLPLTIQDPVNGLKLYGASILSSSGPQLVEVQYDTGSNVSLSFQQCPACILQPISLFGLRTSINLSLPVGIYDLNFIARNDVSSENASVIVVVRDPIVVKNISVPSIQPVGIEMDVAIALSQGTGVDYLINWGDGNETLLTDSSNELSLLLNHVFSVTGKYNISIKLSNNISAVSKMFLISVETPITDLQVQSPRFAAQNSLVRCSGMRRSLRLTSICKLNVLRELDYTCT